VREAQEKAQAIVVEASSQQSQLLDDNEIMRRARATERRSCCVRPSRRRRARVRDRRDAYAAQVLTDLDVRLSGALGSVKKRHRNVDHGARRERRRLTGVARRRGGEVQARRVRRAEPTTRRPELESV